MRVASTPYSAIALALGAHLLAGLGCSSRPDLSADAGIPDADVPPDAQVTPDAAPPRSDGEVRGIRLIPGDDEVTIHFHDAPGADTYIVCWSPEPNPLDGTCRRDITSPHTERELEPGLTLYWTVVAENAEGRSPVVEIPSITPGPASRPLTLLASMEPSDLDELYSRPVTSDDLLPIELKLSLADGQLATIADVRGLRFRGQSSRRLPRKSYNIRLDERPVIPEAPDFNFRGALRDAGNRIVINQTWTDPTGIRPALAYAMYEKLGLPAPSTFFANWWLNEVYEGLYVGIERIDREALRRWGLNRSRGEFTLVRDRARQHRSRPEIDGTSMFLINPETLGETDEERITLLQEVFDYRGELEQHDWAELLDLLRWAHQTPAGSDWEAGLAARFHVESLIDLLALYTLQQDNDSFADDYWLYRDNAGDGLWRVIPWDKDLTFGSRWWSGHTTANDFFYIHGAIDDHEHFENPLFQRTLETFADTLDARVAELYESIFTEAWFDETLENLAAEVRDALLRWPEPAFEAHPRQHWTEPSYFAWHLEALRDFQTLRRVWLTAERREGEPYEFEGEVVLDDHGAGWVTDINGWMLIRLDGTPGDQLDLSVALVDNAEADGLDKAWHLENRGEPWTGRITLYYRNAPNETWVPKLEVAGRNWDLTIFSEGATPQPTRVNPFSNSVSTVLELSGRHVFEVLYRS
jgi:spore coat protein H